MESNIAFANRQSSPFNVRSSWTKNVAQYHYDDQYREASILEDFFLSLGCCLLLVGSQFVSGFSPRLFFQVNFPPLFWR